MFPHYTTLELTSPGEHLVKLVLNRPEVSNAFNTSMCEELLDAILWLNYRSEDIRCLLITGAGDKAFSAGGDLKERQNMNDQEWRAQHKIFERFIREVWKCEIPIISVVNGGAVGGGCELALTADFILAADSAFFALSETSLGIMPGAGGTQNLPRAVGSRLAKQLIFTGERLHAREAYRVGLVNRIYPPEDLMSGAYDIASRVCRNAPLSIKQAKFAINYGMEMNYSGGLELELAAYNQLVGTKDRQEGVNAFNEKRRPIFGGR